MEKLKFWQELGSYSWLMCSDERSWLSINMWQRSFAALVFSVNCNNWNEVNSLVPAIRGPFNTFLDINWVGEFDLLWRRCIMLHRILQKGIGKKTPIRRSDSPPKVWSLPIMLCTCFFSSWSSNSWPILEFSPMKMRTKLFVLTCWILTNFLPLSFLM